MIPRNLDSTGDIYLNQRCALAIIKTKAQARLSNQAAVLSGTVSPIDSFVCPKENCTRREFLREILYKNIAIIAIQHSKMYFVDTFGDFSHTVE